ncbi:MAG: phenylalanine--tRNA ligase subunit beta [Ferruginibacter sp.]
MPAKKYTGMIISYNWLQDYLPEKPELEKLSKILTSTGLEVEKMEIYHSLKGGLKDVVTGKILTCIPHPDADKLKLTTVDVGQAQPLQIVCGAPNAAAGQNVIVALVGATIYPVNGDPITLKKAKIRGVESQGMICAEDEIGVGESHDGIMVLENAVPPGTPAAALFKVTEDIIYEIGLTPNRMDAMSHIGVARDVCAYLTHHNKKETTPRLPYPAHFKPDNTSSGIKVTIADNGACPRYSGISLGKVTVKDSPEWLKEKLKAIGVRPINNIVDITNFILHETGQPLHAFDADKISHHHIIVRRAEEKESFLTLDNKTRSLASGDLVIADESGALCLAGVYGGMNSGVTAATKNIFLESACFNPTVIRKTSLAHQLRTDAASRFEKGTDISNTVNVLKRAAEMIKDLAGGEISSDIIDVYPHPEEKAIVRLSFHYLKKLSGKNYHGDTVKQILVALGFELVKETGDEIVVNVPYHKKDISIPADLVEEIMRIDGLDNIEIPQSIRISPSSNRHARHLLAKENISQMLAGMGFREIFTNSITNSAYYEGHPDVSPVKLLNSLSAGLNIMRPSMLYTGLEAIAYNANRKNTDIRFFEFGKIYHHEGDKYCEENHLAIYLSGEAEGKGWNRPTVKTDAYFMKGVCEKILSAAGLDKITSDPQETTDLANALTFSHRRKPIGKMGQVDTATLQNFGIRQPVYFSVLNWDEISQAIFNQKVSFTPISKFPVVQRDLALVLDKEIEYRQVEKAIQASGISQLSSMRLFDVFESEKLGAGKKSMAINFTFTDSTKTLTDAETDNLMQKITAIFEKQLSAEIRK